MKIQRVVSIYMFYIILIVTSHCSHTGGPKPMLKAAVDALNEGTSANLDKFGKIVEEGGKSLVESSGQLGIQSAKELAVIATQFHKIAAVGTAIYGATQLYPIAQDIKSHWFPTKDQ